MDWPVFTVRCTQPLFATRHVATDPVLPAHAGSPFPSFTDASPSVHKRQFSDSCYRLFPLLRFCVTRWPMALPVQAVSCQTRRRYRAASAASDILPAFCRGADGLVLSARSQLFSGRCALCSLLVSNGVGPDYCNRARSGRRHASVPVVRNAADVLNSELTALRREGGWLPRFFSCQVVRVLSADCPGGVSQATRTSPCRHSGGET